MFFKFLCVIIIIGFCYNDSLLDKPVKRGKDYVLMRKVKDFLKITIEQLNQIAPFCKETQDCKNLNFTKKVCCSELNNEFYDGYKSEDMEITPRCITKSLCYKHIPNKQVKAEEDLNFVGNFSGAGVKVPAGDFTVGYLGGLPVVPPDDNYWSIGPFKFTKDDKDFYRDIPIDKYVEDLAIKVIKKQYLDELYQRIIRLEKQCQLNNK